MDDELHPTLDRPRLEGLALDVRTYVALAAAVTDSGGVMLLITPTVAGYYARWVANNTPVKVFLVLAGVLFTCYIVALGLLLGAGVVARVQLGHRLRAPDSQPAQGAVSCARTPPDL